MWWQQACLRAISGDPHKSNMKRIITTRGTQALHVGHKQLTPSKKMLCAYFLLRARTGALNPETSLWHASPRSQPWQRWRSSRWRWSLTRASCCKVGAAAQSRCVSIAFHSSMCIALGRHLSPQNTIVFNWSTASFRYRQGGAALGGLRTDGPN